MHVLRRGAAAVFLIVAVVGLAPVCSDSDTSGDGADSERTPRLEVPILAYHRVDEPSRRFTFPPVSVVRFDEQMHAIAQSGATSITIDELADALRSEREFPGGAVAITFDDGTADQYVNAFPVLRKYNLRATLYIIAGRVDKEGYLSTRQLREMVDTGLVSVQAHSLRHRDLASVSLAEARSEITRSRRVLERLLGNEVRHFAYPFGSHNSRLEELVRDAGFRSAVTIESGAMHGLDDVHHLGRILIFEETPPGELADAARRGGRWHM